MQKRGLVPRLLVDMPPQRATLALGQCARSLPAHIPDRFQSVVLARRGDARLHFSPMSLTIHTELGVIRMKLRPDAAPTTAAYISKLAQDGVYDGCTFYRSDFVIQCGLHGTGKSAPENLKINETSGEST